MRAEVELASAEITRDVKKGLTGSVFFILALVVLFYSTFFFFFFLAELLDTWLWRWVAFLIVFGIMVIVDGGARAVRLSEGASNPRARRRPSSRSRRSREALTPGHDSRPTKAVARPTASATADPAPADPSGW